MPPKKRAATVEKTVKETVDEVSNAVLDGLLSDGVRTSIEIVSELQASGLGNILSLPEIVVCGDQSAGKSSLLARLTEVPFPQAEDVCTRFATQITLRRSNEVSISATITSGPGTPPAEEHRLSEFYRELTSFKEFPQVVEEATNHMGLQPLGEGDAFSKHRLCVNIAGPTRDHLSLIDLPGLIRSKTKTHTTQDMKYVKELHDDVLKNPQAIILAVMSANLNIALHEILMICEKHDPQRTRTLGIITKPDMIASNEQFRTYAELFHDKGKTLALGWQAVMNQAIPGKDTDFAARTRLEEKFFSGGSWQQIENSHKGIPALRGRISKIRDEQHKTELPLLRNAISKYLTKTQTKLDQMGEKRVDVKQQREVLESISAEVYSIVRDAIAGSYKNDFFPTVGKHDVQDKPRFLLARIQDCRDEFAGQMEVNGHTYEFSGTQEAAGTDTLSHRQWPVTRKEKKLNRNDAVAWVANLHQATRGSELPGDFNNDLVFAAFREQSAPWEGLARKHIVKVEALCSTLIKLAIETKAPAALASRILGFVDGDMEQRLSNADQQLYKLIQDKNLLNAVYDPAYLGNAQKLQNHRLSSERAAAIARGAVPLNWPEYVTKETAYMAAENALNRQLAVYESERTAFIINVAKTVVNDHLLANLAEDTFSPKVVKEMSDEQVTKLAAEPDDVVEKREQLERQKSILEKSRKIFENLLNPYKKRSADEMEGPLPTSGRKRLCRKSMLT